MGYPIYKLLRMVNRQYPNNGFINNIDVTESIYNSDDEKKDGIIPEDLRDLINETIQEVYKDVAIDEVFSFPTVPGQNQYVLPEDCDLRDIQEVTRTFVGANYPIMPPPGGEEPGPEPDPQFDHIVTFSINSLEGTITGEHGTVIGEGTIIYSVQQGNTLKEVPTVEALPGFVFNGWSLDGIRLISDEQLLSTPITSDIIIKGLFEEEEEEMKKLTETLVLTNGEEPTFAEGFYYTGQYEVRVDGGTLPLFGSYSTFYYDAATKTLTGPFASATYDDGANEWLLQRDEMLDTEVQNNDRVPVNSAVFEHTDKDFIAVGLTQPYILINSGPLTLAFDATNRVKGHTFSLHYGKIQVSSPDEDIVARVAVQLRIPSSAGNLNPEWTVEVYINNDAVFSTTIDLVVPGSGTSYQQIVAVPFYAILRDGDEIYVAVTNSADAEVSGGYFTVEEVY